MNIYVGNLAYEVADEDLNESFSAFGTVTSARVIRGPVYGQVSGFWICGNVRRHRGTGSY